MAQDVGAFFACKTGFRDNSLCTILLIVVRASGSPFFGKRARARACPCSLKMLANPGPNLVGAELAVLCCPFPDTQDRSVKIQVFHTDARQLCPADTGGVQQVDHQILAREVPLVVNQVVDALFRIELESFVPFGTYEQLKHVVFELSLLTR